jgi:hypothetical protein
LGRGAAFLARPGMVLASGFASAFAALTAKGLFTPASRVPEGSFRSRVWFVLSLGMRFAFLNFIPHRGEAWPLLSLIPLRLNIAYGDTTRNKT